ncbi:unnamed protein product [Closterium sp. Yama58-4]|nr:unnamed protein product [Closterium sp. Yama58-4]
MALVGLLAGLDVWIEVKKLQGEIGALGDDGSGVGGERGGGGAKERHRVCELPPGVFKSVERDLLGRISEFPKLKEALKQPGAMNYVKLIHRYLEPWRPIANISTGLGHRGFVTPEALEFISISPNLMSCSGHIKVMTLYRLSTLRLEFFLNTCDHPMSFHSSYHPLHPMPFPSPWQDAVTQYRLSSLRLEFFLNTCDHPMSFHSSHWPARGGLPFMSTAFTADTIDIPVPDPLDLTGPYTPDLSTQHSGMGHASNPASPTLPPLKPAPPFLPSTSPSSSPQPLPLPPLTPPLFLSSPPLFLPSPPPLPLLTLPSSSPPPPRFLPFRRPHSPQILWETIESRAVFRGKTTNYELLPAGNWGANPRIHLHLMSPAAPHLMDARINAWSKIPWEKKESRAVFRGKTTNYELLPAGNWGANPRIRLHLMSPAAPHLMDARINAWSKVEHHVVKRMTKDGVRLARKMNFQQFNAFKYQIVADGGGGSCRTCGVLRSNQLIIRQHTPMLQFYEPLLQDRVHWLATSRTFSDLHEAITWAQQHDKAVLKMVDAANRFADHACTWHGRMLYWALLLVKYQDVMAEPEKVSKPARLCLKPIVAATAVEKDPASVTCSDPAREKKQPECAFFCAGGIFSPESFKCQGNAYAESQEAAFSQTLLLVQYLPSNMPNSIFLIKADGWQWVGRLAAAS